MTLENIISGLGRSIPRRLSTGIASLALLAGIAIHENRISARGRLEGQQAARTTMQESGQGSGGLTGLLFPLYTSEPGEFIGYAVTNQGDVPAALSFTAYGPSGEPLPLPTNPARVSLGPHQQMARLGSQVFGSAAGNVAGWVAVESDQPQTTGMFQLGTDDLRNLDGGAAFEHGNPELLFTRIYEGKGSFYGKDATTYVSIVNLDSAEANVGLVLGSHAASVTLPPRGSLYKSISELFGPIFVIGDVLYARNTAPPVDADRPSSFSLMGCSVTKTESAYLTLDAQSLNMYATTLFAPQVAMGGSYFTSLKIANMLRVPTEILMTATLEDGQAPHTRRLSIDPRSGIEDDLATLLGVPPQGSPISGSLVLETETPGIIGDVVFGDASTRRFAAAVPLQRGPVTDGIFNQVASGAGYFTGVALQNSGQLPLNVTLEVYDQNGASQGLVSVAIPGMQRLSDLFSELLPNTAGLVGGYVRVKSDKPVVAQQLFGTDNLEALSAVPLSVPATQPPLDMARRQILALESYNTEAPFVQIHQFRQAAGDGPPQHAWQSAPDTAWRSRTSIAVGDLDADGLDEIVAMDLDNRVRVYQQGNLGVPVIDTQLWVPDREMNGLLAVGDLDGDGRGELAISKFYWAEVWQLQQGLFRKIWAAKPAAGTLWNPTIGDADNDGRNELLFPNSKAGLLVYDTQGSPANWQARQVELPPEAAGPTSVMNFVKVVDLDPSLQNGNEVIGTGNFGRIVLWKYAQGSGTYQTTYVSDQLPNQAWALDAGDVDGDRSLEIIVGTDYPESGMGRIFVYKNAGGSWRQYGSFSTSACEVLLDTIHAGDVDGDGKAEIVYAPTGTDIGCHGLRVYGLGPQGEMALRWKLPQGGWSGFFVSR